MISTISRNLSKLTRSAPRGVGSLHTPQQVQTILRIERARADRSNQPFCLVLFQIVQSGIRPRLRLGKLLMNNARETDSLGWFCPGELCAILPHTDGEGAEAFIGRIGHLASRHSLRLHATVHCYPPQEDNFGDGELVDRRQEKRERRLVTAGQALESLAILPVPRWKRAMDIALALPALVALSPVFLLVSGAIFATSGGPVLFRQRRAGLGNRPFMLYKFRTMVVDAERQKQALRRQSHQDGPAFKMACDPRVTPLGRFLRRTSLDELPQLWNVLKGDMSLVGPRPLPVDESDACAPWHRQRLSVTPGLTCIWQIRGRSRVTFEEWMRMDLSYVRHRRFLHDLRLIFQTIPAVLCGRGAH
jgi:lipopolysaccharide/colanic/teichoic acid biosynthesis glycosyltransferase